MSCSRSAPTPWPDAAVAAALADDKVDRIAATLPRFANKKSHAQFAVTIRTWAHEYKLTIEWRKRGQVQPPGNPWWVPWEQLHQCAKDLIGLLDKMTDTQRRILTTEFTVKRDMFGLCAVDLSQVLRFLADSAYSLDAPRQRGRPKNWVREVFVRDLARIYQQTVGLPPTLTVNNYTQRRRGRFFDFCFEALRPIEGDERAKVGLAPLISRILYDPQNRRPFREIMSIIAEEKEAIDRTASRFEQRTSDAKTISGHTATQTSNRAKRNSRDTTADSTRPRTI